MFFKSAGIIGLALATMLAAGQAAAFSGDAGRDGPPDHERISGPDATPPADYRYSGRGFNFSMSKNAESSDASQSRNKDGEAVQAQPAQTRPGFFRRLVRDVFGD